jgi:hypothetical protein
MERLFLAKMRCKDSAVRDRKATEVSRLNDLPDGNRYLEAVGLAEKACWGLPAKFAVIFLALGE